MTSLQNHTRQGKVAYPKDFNLIKSGDVIMLELDMKMLVKELQKNASKIKDCNYGSPIIIMQGDV